MSYSKPTKSYPLDSAAFRSFMFQGKALFVLENKEKGTYITFRVRTPKKRRDQPESYRFFDIEANTQEEGKTGLKYLGRMDRKYKRFKQSGYVSNDHTGIKTLNWLMEHWTELERFENEGKLGMYHLGICCKCSLPLTVDESIGNGMGPHCKKYQMARTVRIIQELGIYEPDMEYNQLVMHACTKRPDMMDEYFIPDDLRRSSEYGNALFTIQSLGLF